MWRHAKEVDWRQQIASTDFVSIERSAFTNLSVQLISFWIASRESPQYEKFAIDSIEVAMMQFVVFTSAFLQLLLQLCIFMVGWVGNDYQFVEKNTFVDKVW